MIPGKRPQIKLTIVYRGVKGMFPPFGTIEISIILHDNYTFGPSFLLLVLPYFMLNKYICPPKRAHPDMCLSWIKQSLISFMAD